MPFVVFNGWDIVGLAVGASIFLSTVAIVAVALHAYSKSRKK